jgi:hypothetical protein
MEIGGIASTQFERYQPLERLGIESLESAVWDALSVSELVDDLLRNRRVYLPVGGKAPLWWRVESDSTDPILRREKGWSLNWSPTEDVFDRSFIFSGEFRRALGAECEQGISLRELRTAASLFLRRHILPPGVSPFRPLADSVFGKDESGTFGLRLK